MNRFRLHVILFFFLALPVLTHAGQYKVIRVYDGDTLKAVGNGVEIKVRLVGIDAPETSKKKYKPGQPFSQKARKYLSKLVLKRNVKIRSYGIDQYDRTLAEIFANGKNVNIEMLKAGLAEVYRGKPAEGLALDLYRKAESKAKKANIGIWSLGDRYCSPKIWKEIYRDN